MRSINLHKLVAVAVLAALGFVLMNFAIPVIPAFPFLTLDLSDLTVLLAVLLFGLSAGVETALVRSLLHFILTGAGVVNLIGDTAAFFASVLFVLPVALALRNGYNWRRALGALLGGTVVLTIFMSILNYFVLMPMYMTAFGLNIHMSLTKYLLVGVVPFNLIKGVVLTVVFLVFAKVLAPWLAKQRGKALDSKHVSKHA